MDRVSFYLAAPELCQCQQKLGPPHDLIMRSQGAQGRTLCGGQLTCPCSWLAV